MGRKRVDQVCEYKNRSEKRVGFKAGENTLPDLHVPRVKGRKRKGNESDMKGSQYLLQMAETPKSRWFVGKKTSFVCGKKRKVKGDEQAGEARGLDQGKLLKRLGSLALHIGGKLRRHTRPISSVNGSGGARKRRQKSRRGKSLSKEPSV